MARTAEEHLLCAVHYLNVERCAELGSHQDLILIAEVRFDQVMANLIESERLTAGIGRSEWSELADSDQVAEQWEWIDARTRALGWDVVRTSKTARLAHTKGRTSSMELAGTYLADSEDPAIDGRSITQMIVRTRGAVAHGYETGLFKSTKVTPRDHLPSAAVTLEPEQMSSGDLYFSLMTMPLCVSNAMDALAIRFGWNQGVTYERYRAERARMVERWATEINREDPQPKGLGVPATACADGEWKGWPSSSPEVSCTTVALRGPRAWRRTSASVLTRFAACCHQLRGRGHGRVGDVS